MCGRDGVGGGGSEEVRGSKRESREKTQVRPSAGRLGDGSERAGRGAAPPAHGAIL